MQEEDKLDAWKPYAKKVLEQLNWQGHYFGISALCTQYARLMQKKNLSSRERRKFEKVAMQPEPLNPDDNLRLSGVAALENTFIKPQIATYLVTDIQLYCDGISKILDDLVFKIHKLKDKTLQQKIESIRSSYHSTLSTVLRSEHEKGKQVINLTYKKLLSEHQQWFKDIENSRKREESRLIVLLKQFQFAIQRDYLLGKFANTLAHKMLTPFKIIVHNSYSAILKLFRKKYHFLPLKVNLERTEDLFNQIKEKTGISHKNYLHINLNSKKIAPQLFHNLGYYGEVRKQGIGYIGEVMIQTSNKEMRWLMSYYQKYGLKNGNTALHRDIQKWSRIDRIKIKNYHLETSRLLNVSFDNLHKELEDKFQEIESYIQQYESKYDEMLCHISVIRSSIDNLLHLIKNSHLWT